MDSVLRAIFILVWVFTIVHADTNNFLFAPEWQTKLFFNLLRDYHKETPPTHEGPITVELGFRLIHFDFLDVTNEIATAYAWSSRTWTDPRFRWDPDDYNGTKSMVMNIGYIWIPDIELFEGESATKTVESNAVIYSSGRVSYTPSFQIKFVCHMNLRYFPYDEQSCQLKFSSWHYDSSTINLTAEEQTHGIPYTKTSRDFYLTGVTVERDVVKSDCCGNETYHYVIYTISLKRSSEAYSVKLVLPSVLTGFLVLSTFLLPPASYEKITLCGVLFLCLLLLLTYLHDVVPTSGDTILGEYLAFALFIDFFATIMAVLSYNVNTRLQLQLTHRQPNLKDAEGDDTSLKMEMPQLRKREWLQHLDNVGFVLFSIIFIVGLAIILSRRG